MFPAAADLHVHAGAQAHEQVLEVPPRGPGGERGNIEDQVGQFKAARGLAYLHMAFFLGQGKSARQLTNSRSHSPAGEGGVF